MFSIPKLAQALGREARGFDFEYEIVCAIIQKYQI